MRAASRPAPTPSSRPASPAWSSAATTRRDAHPAAARGFCATRESTSSSRGRRGRRRPTAIQPFRKHARTGLPHVLLKSAMTSTAASPRQAATRSGSPVRTAADWSIAGARRPTRCRRDRHRPRRRPAADRATLAAGCAGEVEARGESPTNPGVFDSQARLPLGLRGWSARSQSRSGHRLAEQRADQRGSTHSARPAGRCSRSLASALRGSRRRSHELGRREISSLLVEGGPSLAGAFLESGSSTSCGSSSPRSSPAAGTPLVEAEAAPRIADAPRAL